MNINDLITTLSQYAINDHGKPGEILFYDATNQVYLKPVETDWSSEEGIEEDQYFGCGCISGITLHLAVDKENI